MITAFIAAGLERRPFCRGFGLYRPPFRHAAAVIGMVIVGFGISAPEMLVSALAASQGNPWIALGSTPAAPFTKDKPVH